MSYLLCLRYFSTFYLYLWLLLHIEIYECLDKS